MSDGQFKGWGTGRRHRWGLRVRGWLGLSLVIYFFQSRVLLFTKHRYSIPLDQSVHLQLGFGLVQFGFWSLEYLSTSIDVHSLPSLGTVIWSVKLLNPLHCIPRHSLFFLNSINFHNFSICIMTCGCLCVTCSVVWLWELGTFLVMQDLPYFHVCAWLCDV